MICSLLYNCNCVNNLKNSALAVRKLIVYNNYSDAIRNYCDVTTTNVQIYSDAMN